MVFAVENDITCIYDKVVFSALLIFLLLGPPSKLESIAQDAHGDKKNEVFCIRMAQVQG